MRDFHLKKTADLSEKVGGFSIQLSWLIVNSIRKNRLIFIHYPDGTLIEPITVEDGPYFGQPVCDQGQLVLLPVDFPRQTINLFRHNPIPHKTVLMAALPLSIIKDRYNLHLFSGPLMLTRHSKEDKFQILWPESTEMQLRLRECFDHPEGDKLYFTGLPEDPDYQAKVLVRDSHSCNLLRRMDSALLTMPNGLNRLLV